MMNFRRCRYIALLSCVFSMIGTATIWAQPLPDRRALTGRVSRPDGAPVVGATITLQRENDIGSFAFWGATTVTDAKGDFAFPDAEQDRYFLSVEAEGYAPLQSRSLAWDEKAPPLKLTLRRLVTLRLRLLRVDGAPLVNANALLRIDPENHSLRNLRRKTDARGEIELPKQLPGRTKIYFIAPGHGYASFDRIISDANQAQPIDIALQSGGSLRISAHENTPERRPLGGALLSILPIRKISDADRAGAVLPATTENTLKNFYSASEDGEGTRDGDGAVDLSDLKPGRYAVRLALPGYISPKSQEIDIAKDGRATLDFAFQPSDGATSLRLTLKDKSGAPLANRDFNIQMNALQTAPLEVVPAPFPPDIDEAQNAFPFPLPSLLPRRARSDADGSLTLFPVLPGRWNVTILVGEDAQSRAPIAQREIDIAATGAEATINVESEAAK